IIYEITGLINRLRPCFYYIIAEYLFGDIGRLFFIGKALLFLAGLFLLVIVMTDLQPACIRYSDHFDLFVYDCRYEYLQIFPLLLVFFVLISVIISLYLVLYS